MKEKTREIVEIWEGRGYVFLFHKDVLASPDTYATIGRARRGLDMDFLWEDRNEVLHHSRVFKYLLGNILLRDIFMIDDALVKEVTENDLIFIKELIQSIIEVHGQKKNEQTERFAEYIDLFPEVRDMLKSAAKPLLKVVSDYMEFMKNTRRDRDSIKPQNHVLFKFLCNVLLGNLDQARMVIIEIFKNHIDYNCDYDRNHRRIYRLTVREGDRDDWEYRPRLEWCFRELLRIQRAIPDLDQNVTTNIEAMKNEILKLYNVSWVGVEEDHRIEWLD